MGRATHGVRGIRLRRGDRVVGMETLAAEGDILTVTERGFGKRTALAEYRLQSRGGLGVINLKVSEKTGEVVGRQAGLRDDGLMLITQDGKIIRTPVADVRVIGRSTQGVKLMDLEDEDRVVAAAKLAEGDAEEGDGDEENGDELDDLDGGDGETEEIDGEEADAGGEDDDEPVN